MDNWQTSMMDFQTGKLWLMYMKMVKILRLFLTSSRTGNWPLYIQSLHQMLPYLASASHNNYVKSLVLYLSKMEMLPETHPYIHAKFMECLFVLRRTDSYWAGIFSDLYRHWWVASSVLVG